MKKYIFGLLTGIVLTIGIVVIADTINSNEVLYDNSNIPSNVDNVQDALDDVYNIIQHNSLSFSLLARNPSGLSNELVADMYRYQGTNVNNYICFGSNNKSDCTSDTDKYMYRIIGINESGQMKLIKKEAINTKIQWGINTGMDWPNSKAFADLNGSTFLTNLNYVPNSTWGNKIETMNWSYGDVTDADKTAQEIYNIEINLNNSVSAKIGLMYLHDYYYASPNNVNCFSNRLVCKASWIYLSNNDLSAPHEYEWTIMRYNSSFPWMLDSTAIVGHSVYMYSGLSARPVFFLKASETIASGSGTITDPYILS